MKSKSIYCRGEGKSFKATEFITDHSGRLVHNVAVTPHYTNGVPLEGSIIPGVLARRPPSRRRDR